VPTVYRDGPYRFFFFSNEGEEAPHIHIQSGDKLAKFWLQMVELAYNRGFRHHELRAIRQVIEERQWVFLEAWNDHFDQE
jgi:hypothetical protein